MTKQTSSRHSRVGSGSTGRAGSIGRAGSTGRTGSIGRTEQWQFLIAAARLAAALLDLIDDLLGGRPHWRL